MSWAGSAATRQPGQRLTGMSSSTPSRIELGSHITDCGAAGDWKTNPMRAPM